MSSFPPIEVPRRVAACPYCDASLSVDVTAWEELRTGRTRALEVMVLCDAEPDIDSEEWDDWWEIHRQMPYVYQLPVDQKVLRWVQRTQRGVA